MSTPDVTVYGQPGCQPCKATTRLLDQLGTSYVYVDVSDSPEALTRLRALGHSSTPVTVVEAEDGPVVLQGFKPERLRTLLTPAPVIS